VQSLSSKIKFIESIFGSGRLARNGKNFDIRCPICAPSDKSKKKLSIRVEDDASHCWTCDFRSRSLVTLIKKFGTREQLHYYRDKFMPQTESNRRRCLVVDVPEVEVLKLPSDFCLLTLAPKSDPDVKSLMRYLTARGITERDLWFYKLGYSDDFRWRRRVIMPSFDRNGVLNYFVARAIDKQKRPKYDNPDVDKRPIIFNELNVDWTKPLVLCEGPFDHMKCGENSVPLLGSTLNEESALFDAIIVNQTPVALALDNDMAETKTLVNAKKLTEYNIDVSIVSVPSDPGAMSKEEF
jgi:hypothetical protein